MNLAPAELPKESGRFDLPIALGILAASNQIPMQELERFEFAGELSLTGDLRPVRGALALAHTQKIKSRWLVDFEAPHQKFTVIVENDGNSKVTVWDK